MLAISEAASMLGVSSGTLRRWERENKIAKPDRTLGGHRRYRPADIIHFYNKASHPLPLEKKVICYARVSGRDQAKDLLTQADCLQNWAIEQGYQSIEVIKDLGSGLNLEKRGLKRLLHLLMTAQVGVLVINHRDRLLRFGSELIFSICAYMSVQVKILNEQQEPSDEEKLTRDVIQLMTVFCAKLHGKRSHHNRRKAA